MTPNLLSDHSRSAPRTAARSWGVSTNEICLRICSLTRGGGVAWIVRLDIRRAATKTPVTLVGHAADQGRKAGSEFAGTGQIGYCLG